MVALDIHVHPVLVREALDKESGLLKAAREIFRIGTSPQPMEVLFYQMEIADIEHMIVVALDCTTKAGCKLPSNDTVSWLVSRSGGRFLGFASVDPNLGEAAVKELERAVRDLGLRGLKLSPPLQGFDPTSPKLRPILAKAQELNIPVLIHTGFSYVNEYPLSKCNPLLLEKWILEFPRLNFILAHFGWPWVWEAVTLAMKYPNVYLDVSNVYTGTPEEHMRYLLTEVIPRRVIERFLPGKILFGSDYPRIEADKMVRAIEELPLDPEVKRAILFENAAKLLGIM